MGKKDVKKKENKERQKRLEKERKKEEKRRQKEKEKKRLKQERKNENAGKKEPSDDVENDEDKEEEKSGDDINVDSKKKGDKNSLKNDKDALFQNEDSDGMDVNMPKMDADIDEEEPNLIQFPKLESKSKSSKGPSNRPGVRGACKKTMNEVEKFEAHKRNFDSSGTQATMSRALAICGGLSTEEKTKMGTFKRLYRHQYEFVERIFKGAEFRVTFGAFGSGILGLQRATTGELTKANSHIILFINPKDAEKNLSYSAMANLYRDRFNAEERTFTWETQRSDLSSDRMFHIQKLTNSKQATLHLVTRQKTNSTFELIGTPSRFDIVGHAQFGLREGQYVKVDANRKMHNMFNGEILPDCLPKNSSTYTDSKKVASVDKGLIDARFKPTEVEKAWMRAAREIEKFSQEDMIALNDMKTGIPHRKTGDGGHDSYEAKRRSGLKKCFMNRCEAIQQLRNTKKFCLNCCFSIGHAEMFFNEGINDAIAECVGVGDALPTIEERLEDRSSSRSTKPANDKNTTSRGIGARGPGRPKKGGQNLLSTESEAEPTRKVARSDEIGALCYLGGYYAVGRGPGEKVNTEGKLLEKIADADDLDPTEEELAEMEEDAAYFYRNVAREQEDADEKDSDEEENAPVDGAEVLETLDSTEAYTKTLDTFDWKPDHVEVRMIETETHNDTNKQERDRKLTKVNEKYYMISNRSLNAATDGVLLRGKDGVPVPKAFEPWESTIAAELTADGKFLKVLWNDENHYLPTKIDGIPIVFPEDGDMSGINGGLQKQSKNPSVEAWKKRLRQARLNMKAIKSAVPGCNLKSFKKFAAHYRKCLVPTKTKRTIIDDGGDQINIPLAAGLYGAGILSKDERWDLAETELARKPVWRIGNLRRAGLRWVHYRKGNKIKKFFDKVASVEFEHAVPLVPGFKDKRLEKFSKINVANHSTVSTKPGHQKRKKLLGIRETRYATQMQCTLDIDLRDQISDAENPKVWRGDMVTNDFLKVPELITKVNNGRNPNRKKGNCEDDDECLTFSENDYTDIEYRLEDCRIPNVDERDYFTELSVSGGEEDGTEITIRESDVGLVQSVLNAQVNANQGSDGQGDAPYKMGERVEVRDWKEDFWTVGRVSKLSPLEVDCTKWRYVRTLMIPEGEVDRSAHAMNGDGLGNDINSMNGDRKGGQANRKLEQSLKRRRQMLAQTTGNQSKFRVQDASGRWYKAMLRGRTEEVIIEPINAKPGAFGSAKPETIKNGANGTSSLGAMCPPGLRPPKQIQLPVTQNKVIRPLKEFVRIRVNKKKHAVRLALAKLLNQKREESEDDYDVPTVLKTFTDRANDAVARKIGCKKEEVQFQDEAMKKLRA